MKSSDENPTVPDDAPPGRAQSGYLLVVFIAGSAVVLIGTTFSILVPRHRLTPEDYLQLVAALCLVVFVATLLVVRRLRRSRSAR